MFIKSRRLDLVKHFLIVVDIQNDFVDGALGFPGAHPRLLQLLRQALSELPNREREIVTMRFGLEGRQELTQKEVAQHMGISQSYISRLEKRIMLRLRKELDRLTGCA